MNKKTDENYWENYTNLQRVKHNLIKQYLNGWLPKLGSTYCRILYLETHAGRGSHETGDLGSPLIALETFLNHSRRESVFGSCEVVFFFIEEDQKNCELLKEEISKLDSLPSKCRVIIKNSECFSALNEIIQYLEISNQHLAPAFIFIDPYGFKIPGQILHKLMKYQHVELFINVMWRELYMFISQHKDKRINCDLLDSIFYSQEWRNLYELSFNDSADECIHLFRNITNARWSTYIRMMGDSNSIKYMLLHLSNHDEGRKLMKECIWKICPDGGFYASIKGNLNQKYLIEPDSDLSELKKLVLKLITESPRRWSELIEKINDEIWLSKHLNETIRNLRKSGIINGRNYEGKFALSNNPELFLKQENKNDY